jgi:hypothetical protein
MHMGLLAEARLEPARRVAGSGLSLPDCLPELAHALAERPGEVRQTSRAEDHQRHHRDEQKVNGVLDAHRLSG